MKNSRGLKIGLGDTASCVLRMADFNRLRWVLDAIKVNAELRSSLVEASESKVLDSVSLISGGVTPAASDRVVLWDGFNSYRELLGHRPDLSERDDIHYLYVGSFAEVIDAMPTSARPLFPRRGAIKEGTCKVPFKFRAARHFKTGLRALRNQVSYGDQHRRISQDGKVVFCGLLRPNPSILTSILTGTNLEAGLAVIGDLALVDWQTSVEQTQSTVAAIYEDCQRRNSGSADDLCAAYSILNICQRILVVHHLMEMGSKLFINEFGRQPHFDPYDSFSYSNNTFLDFGSSRGACLWYPRTMDMRSTGKRFFELRFMMEDESLGSYFADTSAALFLQTCKEQAERVLGMQA